jgi:hypothetical protein
MHTKSDGKKPFGRTTHRWEDNIRMDLTETGCEDMDMVQLQTIMNTVMNFQVHKAQGIS